MDAYPTSSSSFAPPSHDEERKAIRDMLSAVSRARQTGRNDEGVDMAVDDDDGQTVGVIGGDDKENTTKSSRMQSRSSSSSSLKSSNHQDHRYTSSTSPRTARRRSSAAHPLTPRSASTAVRRSRPSSVVLEPNSVAPFSHTPSKPLSGSQSPVSHHAFRESASSTVDSSYDPASGSGTTTPATEDASNLVVSTKDGPSVSLINGHVLQEEISQASQPLHETFSHIPRKPEMSQLQQSSQSGSPKRDSGSDGTETGLSSSFARPRTNTGDSDQSSSTQKTARASDTPLSLSHDRINEIYVDDFDTHRAESPLRHPWEAVIRIKDYAFGTSDPRFIGQPAEVEAINIPPPIASGSTKPWYHSAMNMDGDSLLGEPQDRLSSSLLSISSSSSLSSDFTPPPFGAFGFGHAYHNPQHDRVHGGVAKVLRESNLQQALSDTNETDQSASSSLHGGWTRRASNSDSSNSQSSLDESSSENREHGQDTWVQRPDRSDGQGGSAVASTSSALTSDLQSMSLQTSAGEAHYDDPHRDGSMNQSESYGSDGKLFRAVYTFASEAPHEMSITVDGTLLLQDVASATVC